MGNDRVVYLTGAGIRAVESEESDAGTPAFSIQNITISSGDGSAIAVGSNNVASTVFVVENVSDALSGLKADNDRLFAQHEVIRDVLETLLIDAKAGREKEPGFIERAAKLAEAAGKFAEFGKNVAELVKVTIGS